MAGWPETPPRHVVVHLSANEAGVLRHVLEEVRQLLAERADAKSAGTDDGLGVGFAVREPSDAVLGRLLPTGYADDPQEAREFRRLTEPDLVVGKIAHAGAVIGHLARGEVDSPVAGEGAVGGAGPFAGERPVELRLDEDEVDTWLMAVNDARLALGTRLKVTQDMDYEQEIEDAAGADPAGGRAAGLVVYHFLGALQESLLAALTD